MKITDVTVHKMNPGVGKNFVFVKIQTDAGITGWGEAYTQADRDVQIEAHIHQLARYLDGRDPFHIRHFTHIVHEDFATKRPGMDLHCAVSGIEIAMWDIVGKALERPVYDLLGGPTRPRIRLYANGWGGSGSPEEVGQAAAKVVEERGFTALKFDPFPGPWDGVRQQGRVGTRREGCRRRQGGCGTKRRITHRGTQAVVANERHPGRKNDRKV